MEEEEAQEQKFICKFCDKVCLSGRSLGGHMRGHLQLIAAAKKQKTKADKNSDQNSVQSRSGKIREKGKSLVLGEDDEPNKSWKVFYSKHSDLERERLKGFPDNQRRYEEEEHHLCKKCGKVFDSIRALNGHMQIHSKRSRLSREESMENQCPVLKKRSAIRGFQEWDFVL
nr:zinc finger protein ZAT1-like [Ipomoea batatas]GME08997.1 zinc finger protein ZAT1-like [Ipomoea batatas]